MKGIPKKEIVGQLDRILSSPQISGSAVLSDFLRFVVHEAIDGRGDDLKEYTIGVNALRRDVDFNPQMDSIVRIHAGRLRRAVKEYYYELGTNDPIVISIPKGSYQPAFERKTETAIRRLAELDEAREENGHKTNGHSTNGHTTKEKESIAVDDSPGPSNGVDHDVSRKFTVAVLPFRHIGLDETLSNFCEGLGEYISTELTAFNDFRVISNRQGAFVATQLTDIHQLGVVLRARYIITGSVQLLRPMVRVWTQLNDSGTGDQLWAHTFETTYVTDTVSKFQDEVVDKVLAGITGLNGAVSRNELTTVQNHQTEANIAYWFTRHTNNFEEKTISLARKYYEGVLRKDPNNALVLGYLSEILAGETLLPSTKDKSQNKAMALARQAIMLDPTCQQAYQALAVTLLLQRKKQECVEILKQGLAINPKSTDFQGAMGALLIFAGDFDQGAVHVKRAIDLTPNLPWWQIFSLSFYYYIRKDYQEALFLISRMQVDVIWIPIIKAVCFTEMGQIDEAKAIIRQLKTTLPAGIDLTSHSTLSQFFYSEPIIEGLSAGLKKLLG